MRLKKEMKHDESEEEIKIKPTYNVGGKWNKQGVGVACECCEESSIIGLMNLESHKQPHEDSGLCYFLVSSLLFVFFGFASQESCRGYRLHYDLELREPSF